MGLIYNIKSPRLVSVGKLSPSRTETGVNPNRSSARRAQRWQCRYRAQPPCGGTSWRACPPADRARAAPGTGGCGPKFYTGQPSACSDAEARTAYLEPLALLLGEHDLLNHLRLNRNRGETLETEPDVAVEVALRLENAAWSEAPQGDRTKTRFVRTLIRLTASADSIRMPHLPALSTRRRESDLGQDTLLTRRLEELTKTGLIRDNVAGNKYRIGREALRTFVNVQERTESMPGAMLQTRCPVRTPPPQ